MIGVFPVGPLEPDPDEIRSAPVDVDALDELAYVLHEQGYCGEVCVCVDDARALLPVVDRIANERAAAELRAAADELIRLSVGSGYNGWYASWLRDRADALDPS